MKKRRCLCLSITLMVMFFGGVHLSQAAHFSLTGTSSLSGSDNLTLTQFQWCNYNFFIGTFVTTIDPDGAESIGDPVTISYCYSVTGSTTTPGSPYVAIAGIGDSSSFDVGCLDAANQPDAHYT